MSFPHSQVQPLWLTPADYEVRLVAYEIENPWRAQIATIPSYLSCPQPTHPTQFEFSDETDFWLTMTATLSWQACTVPGECCCPCTYRIYRNGEFRGMHHCLLVLTSSGCDNCCLVPSLTAGTSESTNFTESGLTSGTAYNYSVVVVDRNGVESDPNTCTDVFVLVPGALSKTAIENFVLYCLLALLVLLILFGLALLWKQRVLDKVFLLLFSVCNITSTSLFFL